MGLIQHATTRSLFCLLLVVLLLSKSGKSGRPLKMTETPKGGGGGGGSSFEKPPPEQTPVATMKKDTKGDTGGNNCPELLKNEEKLLQEIGSYQADADKIIDAVLSGVYKGRTFQELSNFVDMFPTRQSGFQKLEQSIDFVMERMREGYGLENVRGEEVQVPRWVRGEESAEMLEPLVKSIPLLGVGSSVGTPQDGITADVLVVKSFEDLDRRAREDQVAGKIVVYNQGWLGSYRATWEYRRSGASHAAQYGAKAVLIESLTPVSLHLPHTGWQFYWGNVSSRIPTACITREDADLMYQLQDKGQRIRVTLKMTSYNDGMGTSRNVIGEIRGREIESEFVAVSGHIDSWDVGQGAMDDGGGVMISLMALGVLKGLGFRPRRTLQAIFWTGEEEGLWGVKAWAKTHHHILKDYSVVFESDSGTFQPLGLDFAGGSEKAGCIVKEVLVQLCARLNATVYARYYPSVSSDISRLTEEAGVPGLSLNTENERYYWYHHSAADTMGILDSSQLDYNTALWAVTSYVLSDLSIKLPRDDDNKS